MTLTVQDCVWSLEEAGKLNEVGNVETHEAGSGFPPVPVTAGDAVKASLFLGSVMLWENELLLPAAIVNDLVEGL